MARPRVWSYLGLLLGGVLLGIVLGELIRPGHQEPTRETSERQAKRIQGLEAELERLREHASATAATPSGLKGRPEAGSAPVTGADVPAAEPSRPAPAPDTLATEERAASPSFAPGITSGELVRRLDAARARQIDTRLAGAELAARFPSNTSGPVVRADEITPGADLEDGTVIVLDEGVHDLSAFADAHRGDFPTDLTFRGIGRDRTLLILHEVASSGAIENLAFEDLTLDTRGHYLADVRDDEPITLRFDRARVLGFDSGPGGAVLLAARLGAVLARDTEFLSAFGNAPGTGSFFHVRGPFLVRFERCLVRGPFRSLYEKSPKAAYAYVECRFEAMHPDRRRDLETPTPNVRLQDCAIDYAEIPDGGPPRRPITELNADWE